MRVPPPPPWEAKLHVGLTEALPPVEETLTKGLDVLPCPATPPPTVKVMDGEGEKLGDTIPLKVLPIPFRENVGAVDTVGSFTDPEIEGVVVSARNGVRVPPPGGGEGVIDKLEGPVFVTTWTEEVLLGVHVEALKKESVGAPLEVPQMPSLGVGVKVPPPSTPFPGETVKGDEEEGVGVASEVREENGFVGDAVVREDPIEPNAEAEEDIVRKEE